jgi:solute carrier family 45, member 1/2/4
VDSLVDTSLAATTDIRHMLGLFLVLDRYYSAQCSPSWRQAPTNDLSGWFPFLFYSTTWVGETYFRYDVPGGQSQSKDALGDIGRIGSTSLTIYSTITLVASIVMPIVVKSPDDNEVTKRPPEWLAKYLDRFASSKPDLLNVWMWGHIIFSVTMAMAPFARSYRFATALVAMCGM